MPFTVGSLVQTRGREWVVLPESGGDFLVLRPLGGMDEEIAGVFPSLEEVKPARFELPDPNQAGDFNSARLLRDAIRLGFRSSAGPFRSFGSIAVEPRPYQLVPLLMALKLDPVRMLIADDVGIGKTIEACLVARELLDRGEIRRIAVLCPPHLAEQWQRELNDKFHIDAALVLPGTVRRLEARRRHPSESVFERYPFVVVSTDYIKSDRRRDDFIRTCPEFVIVDEAHTCAAATEGRSSQHKRNELIAALSDDPERHLLLVTATPHSGKTEAFRSLLALLRPEFSNLPDELTGRDAEPVRRNVAQHLVQRRRGDIRQYLGAETSFPEREAKEITYHLSQAYQKLFDRILAYVRDSVGDGDVQRNQQRVRWWSAIALLRSLGSSPAAAAATLRNRAATAGMDSEEEIDELGKRTVLDLTDDDSTEGIDVIHGSGPGEDDPGAGRMRKRLLELAREAEAIEPDDDTKLTGVIDLVKKLVSDGFRPIVFCRFIPTAEYVAEHLRDELRGVDVRAVTGALPPTEREARVEELGQSDKRVLVATDCLSEGINLQQHFDAVIHYDLSWNPTRHEQREGRVDRFGQKRETVRVVTYFGENNPIDGFVLDVLLRKHVQIHKALGISVPVPVDSNELVEAIMEGLILRSKPTIEQMELFEDLVNRKKIDLHDEWDRVSEREKKSRTVFAQESIKVDTVRDELEAMQRAIGSNIDLRRFVRQAVELYGGHTDGEDPIHVDVTEVPKALEDAIRVPLGERFSFDARFELPVSDREVYLGRTHPFVEALASHTMNDVLDGTGRARRCGVIQTTAVDRRTTLLLVRYRFHLSIRRRGGDHQLLAEDCQTMAFRGSTNEPEWLDPDKIEGLLAATPAGNVPSDRARHFLQLLVDGFEPLQTVLNGFAETRATELLDAHRRVRDEAQARGRYDVEPQLPVDVLGAFIFLPAAP